MNNKELSNGQKKRNQARSKDSENLYNVVLNKTKRVNWYVDSLNEPLMGSMSFDEWQTKSKIFNEKIALARKAKSANESLDIIGYRFGQRPTIYEDK